MSTANIRAALVNAYVAGNFGLPTAYENRDFEPDNSQPWAKLSIVPNQPSVATLGDAGEDGHDGFMQIDLNYPLGHGDVQAAIKADEFRNYFSAGRGFIYAGQAVTIASCGRGIGRREESSYRIIITINYYARTAR